MVDVGYAHGNTISVQLLPPAEQSDKKFGLLSVAHHWTANDVYRYTATLTAWNGTAFTAIGSGVSTIVDPKALTPQTKAVFTNLKQGTKYQVGIVASGNVGGTAATTTLNSATPTRIVYDFSASQDVENTLSSSAAITFDTVPFSGVATLAPVNTPFETTDFIATLVNTDTAVVVASGNYDVYQNYRFANLKAGTHYHVTLTATEFGIPLADATSSIFTYDPTRQDVEQALTVPVTF